MVRPLGPRAVRALAADRQRDVPASPHAKWRERRCGREKNEGSAVRAGDADATGALPVPPIPKAALVTGGAQRIGRALALALAEDGFAVAVHYHSSRNAAERLAARIRGDGGKAI